MAAVAEESSSATPATTGKVKPQLPPRMSKPDKVRYEQEIDELNDEIESIKKQREKILKSIKLAQNGGSAFNDAIQEARKVMSAIVKTKNGIMAERKVLFDKRDLIKAGQDKMREMTKTMSKTLGNLKTVGDIDRKISQLHERQSTSNMSLKEEKDLVKQIDSLVGMRKTVAAFTGHTDNMKAAADEGKGLAVQIAEKNRALKEIGEKIVEAKKAIEAIEKSKSSATADVSPLRAQMDALKAEQEKKITAIKAKRKDWKVINDEYFEYVKALRKIKAEIRKIEDEEWAIEKEKQRIEYEKELANTKPWLEEIASCDLLTDYLKSLKPVAASAVSETAQKKAHDRLASGFAGMKVMKKKGEEESIFKNDRSQKKNKRNAKNAAKKMRDKDLMHTLDTISSFDNLRTKSKMKDLKPPICTEDIDDCLKLLKQCRDYFDTLPRPVRVVSEKKDKKTMTEFGEGQVVEKRADGVKIVKLEWATLYMQK